VPTHMTALALLAEAEADLRAVGVAGQVRRTTKSSQRRPVPHRARGVLLLGLEHRLPTGVVAEVAAVALQGAGDDQPGGFQAAGGQVDGGVDDDPFALGAEAVLATLASHHRVPEAIG
jgi:hypothetical protein